MGIRRSKQAPVLSIIILTVVIVGAMLYSAHIGRSMVQHYTPLIKAATGIKLETTAAHLWFKEAGSGNQSLKIEGTLAHLGRAEQYAQTMLEERRTSESRITPPALRNEIQQALNRITAFKAEAKKRWQAQAQSGIGSDANQDFDNLFNNLLASADRVESTLQQAIEKQLQRFYSLQVLLVAIIVILSTLVGVMLKRHEQRRTRDLLALQERKKKLQKTNRLYATLSQVNQAVAQENEKQKLFQKICDIAIEFGKFRLAWIGFIDDKNGLIQPAAVSGEGSDYLHDIKISVTGDLHSKGPTGRSIHQGIGVVFNDLENNPDYEPWRNSAIEKGYRSSGAFPIRVHNDVIGTLNIYAVEANFFDEEEVKLLEDAARAISFALEKIEDEEKHKQAEQKTTRFSEVLKHSLNEIYIFDSNTLHFTDVNLGAQKNLGYTLDELKKLTPLDIKPRLAADSFTELLKPLYSGAEQIITFTTVHRRKNGTCYPVEIRLQLMPGKPPVFVALIVDITERAQAEALLRASEAKFRSIFHSSAIGMIIVINEKGAITEWNAGAEQVFGYTVDEAVGQPLTLLIPERYKKAHAKGFAQALAQGGLSHSGISHELSGLRKNGQEFPLELTLGSWKREGKLYFSAIILDTTERKQSEAILRRSQKMEAIGQLTGGIAHDFNNILSIILGNINLLSQHISDDKQALKRADAINKSALRAADLTKQLLRFSRSQATKSTIININRAIDEMDNFISRSLTPEIAVDKHFADDLWLTAVDYGDFQDALLNLVINARDAMSGSGTLTLETNNCTLDTSYCAKNPGVAQGQYVQLAISDNGKGISAEVQERIFEPFFTTKEPGKGTGLGLAMVFGFAKRSGGHVNVYSEPGIGTIFRLYLPRTQAQEGAIKPVNQQALVQPAGCETILAVDDEEALLELAQTSLQALGYQVLTACNGQQAVAQLEKNPAIDLLFSDVVMPGGMNGYELAEQATSNFPELKILLTSGYTEKAVAHNGQARFATNILGKPYSHAELAQQVRTVLDEPKPGSTNQYPPKQASAQHANFCTEWSSAFSLGVEVIDRDHQQLLALLHQSQQALTNGNKSESLAILNQLWGYIQIHFQREELVMATCAYPELGNHRQVHQLLTSQVGKMQKQLSRGELTPDNLAAFLSSWLINHIQGMDHAFAPYCKGKTKLIEQALAKEKLL